MQPKYRLKLLGHNPIVIGMELTGKNRPRPATPGLEQSEAVQEGDQNWETSPKKPESRLPC